MATTQRPTSSRSNVANTTFTRNLRYELAGEEGRALLGSYGISISLAIVFLLFVYLSDPPMTVPGQEQRIAVEFKDPPPPEEPEPQPEPEQAAPAQRPTPRPQPRASQQRATTPTDVRSAFQRSTTGGMVGDVSNVLRGTEVAAGSGETPSRGGGKVVLAAGEGGVGSRPGRSTGSPGGTAGVGQVAAGTGVGRAGVRVSSPSVVSAPDMGGPGRDMSDLGTFVRSRQSELRYCYEERGLKANPSLAGTIYVAIGIASSGRVTSANVTRRTWGGAGASDAESCIVGKIRNWRFPSSSAGEGTYSFPFNFTT